MKKKITDAIAWLDDLRATIEWYARFHVWSPPTRRWEGPKGLSWPISPKLARRLRRPTRRR